MRTFNKSEIKSLYRPDPQSRKEDNGQVTIAGGSKLFHGAPLLSLKVASRICDMVFFASPEESVGRVAEQFKSKLFSYIWVPWNDVEAYIKKSDAALIGPGFMRYNREARNSKSEIRNKKLDKVGKLTYEITKKLLLKFPKKRWVIDAGSLQVIGPELLPKGCVITPNEREFEMLFGEKLEVRGQSLAANLQTLASEYNCVINAKGERNIVCASDECVEIPGGNPGLTKGGVGDVLAGLTVSLLSKNEPFWAASAASYITKAAADELFKKVGTNYNADDLADKIPETLHKMT